MSNQDIAVELRRIGERKASEAKRFAQEAAEYIPFYEVSISIFAHEIESDLGELASWIENGKFDDN
ncbi:hypothetical protein ACLI1U_002352 (plasmid) [Corynebacterium sp. LaCa7]|uniref:hypothetical protein n=1 Tax=Corynebacterium sp. LaCa7 TaxID=3391429 RepID=UPI003989E149